MEGIRRKLRTSEKIKSMVQAIEKSVVKLLQLSQGKSEFKVQRMEMIDSKRKAKENHISQVQGVVRKKKVASTNSK